MIVSAISDEVLVSINTIEMVAIVYLAIAVSNLRRDLARLEGKFEQYTANHKEAE